MEAIKDMDIAYSNVAKDSRSRVVLRIPKESVFGILSLSSFDQEDSPQTMETHAFVPPSPLPSLPFVYCFLNQPA